MRRVPTSQPLPLHDLACTRHLEAAASAAPAGASLMIKAGLSIARLARAIAPHARTIWVACGPGNNGGDGLYAACHLQRWAQEAGGRTQVVVTHPGAGVASAGMDPRSSEWRTALAHATSQGISPRLDPPAVFDLAIDAVLGIGLSRPLEGRYLEWVTRLRDAPCPVLNVDVPSGLDAMTGMTAPGSDEPPPPGTTVRGPRHTIAFLSLKPGLFTGQGRDLAGEVWLDDLGRDGASGFPPVAWLHAEPRRALPARPHASHKGSFGEVLVVGGQDIGLTGEGMTGAALLAARAALYAGSGRVYVCLLSSPESMQERFDPLAPDLMFRQMDQALDSSLPDRAVVVCGCGAGRSVDSVLPPLLQRCPRLVLDADALNAVARLDDLRERLLERSARRWITVLTPHPLEAARLLGSTTASVMNDRLGAARTLADRTGTLVVLKGSGTIVAGPGGTPLINASGGPALATAGTGDVLAGMLGAALSASPVQDQGAALAAVCSAVFQHGALADLWYQTSGEQNPPGGPPTLTASRLAQAIRPLF